MKIENTALTLVNIYEPNNDNPDLLFFQNLVDHLLSFECEEIIVRGDFDLVMFRRIKREERRQRIEIRLKKSGT